MSWGYGNNNSSAGTLQTFLSGFQNNQDNYKQKSTSNFFGVDNKNKNNDLAPPKPKENKAIDININLEPPPEPPARHTPSIYDVALGEPGAIQNIRKELMENTLTNREGKMVSTPFTGLPRNYVPKRLADPQTIILPPGIENQVDLARPYTQDVAQPYSPIEIAQPYYPSRLSDEREKKDIDEQPGALNQFLDKLAPYKYEYKNPDMPGAAHGEQIGVMAQDVRKSELGKNFVQKDDDGTLYLDYGKMLPTFLAALADQHNRINELEKGKKK